MGHIVELSPEQRELGLRLALKDLDEPQYRVQAEALHEAETASLPSRLRLWGIFNDELLAGSILVQVQPGRSALLWPPRTIDGEPPQTPGKLLATAIQDLARIDLRMVQVLMPTDAGYDADLLRGAGFRHFSDLLYLACPESEFPSAPPSSGLEFYAIQGENDQRFGALVEATYEGTLDCPAVNGLRCIEDVLLGYRATGIYDPHGWLIVRRQGENIGCLIVTDYPQFETRELIYMGLLPAARRQGHGLAIVRHALWQAATARRQRLVLAVDAANEPALRMYAAAGFQAWDCKSVFMRVVGT
jgi:mycothiol synthase